MKNQTKQLGLLMLLNCILFPALYFFVVPTFPPIMIIYLVLGTVQAFVYVIYNKGFSGKGVTPEMLPDTMPYEEKLAFIEDSKRRMHRSRWMLTLIFPILLTFMLEMMVQFLFPMLKGLFS